MRPPFIQVAGIIDEAEADLLVACGVTHLGFPFRLPVHREDLGEREAAAIIRALPLSVCPVLITYLERADEIARLCDELGVSWVQLHGSVAPEEIGALKKLRPDLFVIKSLIVSPGRTEVLAREARSHEPYADAFITDSHDPKTGASGATGLLHDWRIDRRLRASLTRPLVIAGGLRPANVFDAIRAIGPAGVDVHTGVEGADGRKRADLVRAFVLEARRGFAAGDRAETLSNEVEP